MAKLAPYAVNVQVKTEIKREGRPKKEEADLSRIVGILRQARYSGYVVLEYEAPDNPMTAIPRAIKSLRWLINE
jgi:sugar phosphate isomerase/epimerase